MSEPSSPTERQFDVEVCRTGFGFATISVRAPTEYEAGQKALDLAGNHLYNEKGSEYTLVNPVPALVHQKRVMQLTIEMESQDDCAESFVGVQIEVDFLFVEQLKRLAKLVQSEGLSEVRYFTVPDDWLVDYDTDDEHTLDAFEAVVGGDWLSYSGRFAGSEHIAKAQSVDIERLVEAFESGAEELVVSGCADPLLILERLGRPLDRLDVGVRTVVIGATGPMSPDDYAHYLSVRSVPRGG